MQERVRGETEQSVALVHKMLSTGFKAPCCTGPFLALIAASKRYFLFRKSIFVPAYSLTRPGDCSNCILCMNNAQHYCEAREVRCNAVQAKAALCGNSAAELCVILVKAFSWWPAGCLAGGHPGILGLSSPHVQPWQSCYSLSGHGWDLQYQYSSAQSRLLTFSRYTFLTEPQQVAYS